jgi:hypothetical protein
MAFKKRLINHTLNLKVKRLQHCLCRKKFLGRLGWGECSRNLLHCIVLHEKSQKIFFVLVLVAIYQEGLHVGPHATEVWGAWAVLLPLKRLLLEEMKAKIIQSVSGGHQLLQQQPFQGQQNSSSSSDFSSMWSNM